MRRQAEKDREKWARDFQRAAARLAGLVEQKEKEVSACTLLRGVPVLLSLTFCLCFLVTDSFFHLWHCRQTTKNFLFCRL